MNSLHQKKNDCKNYLFILFGPSGAGKTTILNYIKHCIDAESAPKYTSRPSRGTEEDSRDFIFCKPDAFPIEGVLCFESYGYLFGIQLDKIKASLRNGKSHVIIVGHSEVVKKLSSIYKGSTVSIFVYCHSDELKNRTLNDPSFQRTQRWPDISNEIKEIYDQLGCVDFVVDSSVSTSDTFRQVDKLLSRL